MQAFVVAGAQVAVQQPSVQSSSMLSLVCKAQLGSGKSPSSILEHIPFYCSPYKEKTLRGERVEP